MRILNELFRAEKINLSGNAISREAVRGIIIENKKLLMIYSSKNGDYKFPGGGTDIGESYEDTLIREVREESGAMVTKVKSLFGIVIEYDKPIEKEFDVFKMTSYYYICEVSSNFGKQSLDKYEKELGFIPVWIDINKAIEINKTIIESAKKTPQWTKRETSILEIIRDELIK